MGLTVAVLMAVTPLRGQDTTTASPLCPGVPAAALTANPRAEVSVEVLHGAVVGRGSTTPWAAHAQLNALIAPFGATNRWKLGPTLGLSYTNPSLNVAVGGRTLFRVWRPSLHGLDFGTGVDLFADGQWVARTGWTAALGLALDASFARVILRSAKDVRRGEGRLEGGVGRPLWVWRPHPASPPDTERFANAKSEAETALRNTYTQIVGPTVRCGRMSAVLRNTRRFLRRGTTEFTSVIAFIAALQLDDLADFADALNPATNFGAVVEAGKARLPGESDEAWARAATRAFVDAMIRVQRRP